MKILLMTLLLVVGVGSVGTSMAMYSDIPDSPEVHFKADIPKYATVQHDFSWKIVVKDDRTAYCTCAPAVRFLDNANVTTIIYPSWTDTYIIETFESKSSSRGYMAEHTFVTTHDYLPHGLYNMTISVQYGDSIDTQHFQFWTIQRS